MTQPSNRRAVDDLADIRVERRRLEEREAKLLADGADLEGDDWSSLDKWAADVMSGAPYTSRRRE
jgi:hypothetical protein